MRTCSRTYNSQVQTSTHEPVSLVLYLFHVIVARYDIFLTTYHCNAPVGVFASLGMQIIHFHVWMLHL